MDLVKLFMLKHADAEPVIINNITYAHEHAELARMAMGPLMIEKLEVLVRTLLVLQEIHWTQERTAMDTVHWREDTVEAFVVPFGEADTSREEERVHEAAKMMQTMASV